MRSRSYSSTQDTEGKQRSNMFKVVTNVVSLLRSRFADFCTFSHEVLARDLGTINATRQSILFGYLPFAVGLCCGITNLYRIPKLTAKSYSVAENTDAGFNILFLAFVLSLLSINFDVAKQWLITRDSDNRIAVNSIGAHIWFTFCWSNVLLLVASVLYSRISVAPAWTSLGLLFLICSIRKSYEVNVRKVRAKALVNFMCGFTYGQAGRLLLHDGLYRLSAAILGRVFSYGRHLGQVGGLQAHLVLFLGCCLLTPLNYFFYSKKALNWSTLTAAMRAVLVGWCVLQVISTSAMVGFWSVRPWLETVYSQLPFLVSQALLVHALFLEKIPGDQDDKPQTLRDRRYKGWFRSRSLPAPKLTYDKVESPYLSATTCILCADNPSEAVCMPCKHQSLCNSCSEKHVARLRECPTCRTRCDTVYLQPKPGVLLKAASWFTGLFCKRKQD
eukprot:gb/GECG01005852.1/.p1 GENE.gb/GECG01005852.1/~~gb/GECG01005852.1/.p1  ORF type:complete len:445 (+),score=15.14 gb/GECG01005852.1/:1-1335(+)